MDQGRRLNQLKSLAVALIASGSRFTEELIFSPGMAIKSANNVNLESSQTQVLHKADREILSQCKNMLKSGECPPLLVVSDPVQGYIVQADETIKDLTFICEYTGEVDYLKNRDCDNSYSLMMLLEATNPAEDLVICPDKFGNISRFLSGINNFRRESRKKLNCKLVRYNVDGEMRVFIVAIRKIEKGTTLYCDYNAGGYTYPTYNFV
uniref:SET domain-containing protein n=1 Tax=Kalanchoe fedtschenkoi TaxID=63787 RepID=A0A7N0TDW0_KALFE